MCQTLDERKSPFKYLAGYIKTVQAGLDNQSELSTHLSHTLVWIFQSSSRNLHLIQTSIKELLEFSFITAKLFPRSSKRHFSPIKYWGEMRNIPFWFSRFTQLRRVLIHLTTFDRFELVLKEIYWIGNIGLCQIYLKYACHFKIDHVLTTKVKAKSVQVIL